jgi:hypothetical protein
MKLRLLFSLCVCALVAVGVWPTTAVADPFVGPPICGSAGAALSGHREGNLYIRGDAYVPAGKTLRVDGNLRLRPGSCLDAFTLGTVHVGGNVRVREGAVLALGCTPNSIGPVPPCGTTTTNDTVGGNLIANEALTMYLDGNTIHGDLISRDGGPGLEGAFLNFPIKDNTIDGDLVVRRWQGGWAGAIRNTVGGNLIFSGNGSVTDTDSNEVQTNVVTGDLRCWGNSPAAQVNPIDGGVPNTVGGQKLGQCAGL